MSADGGRPTTTEEFSTARQVVQRSGLVAALAPLLDSDNGRPRHLSLEGLLVAMQVNALHRHHQGHIIEVARVLNAMTPEQRGALGIVQWDADEAYPRVDWLFGRLCRVLEENEHGLDASWFANELARAAIPADFLRSRSVAVDGTDVETWGKLHGNSFTIELDGEAADSQLIEQEQPPPRVKVRTAKVFSIGPDGRKVYTR
ncbi:MAG: hypothetical protein WB592_03535, partial [Acidimicrobiales bacterium]